MYTVYDFVNNDILSSHMKFGWKVETSSELSGMITLSYTMLNFDWKSLEFIGNDLWNMFLNSNSYQIMKLRLDKSQKKFGRLRFDACSINDLKTLIHEANLKIDIDKLISKTISKKSEKIKEKIEERKDYE